MSNERKPFEITIRPSWFIIFIIGWIGFSVAQLGDNLAKIEKSIDAINQTLKIIYGFQSTKP